MATNVFLSTGGLYTAAKYLYPPFFAFLVAPLASVPFDVAEKLWFFILLASLAGSFFFLFTSFSERSSLLLALLIFLFSQFEPLYVGLSYYQADLLILFILVVAYRLERKGLFFGSGACLALGALIKVTPLYFLFYFLVSKKWRSMAGFIGGLLFFGGLSVLSVGTKGWADFFLYGVPALLENSAGNRLDLSFTNLLLSIQRLLGREEIGKSSLWIRTGSIAFSVTVLFSLWFFLRKDKAHSLELRYATIICAMLLSASTMMETHLVLLLFPFSILVSLFFQYPEKNTKHILFTSVAFAMIALRYGYTAPFFQERGWALLFAKAKFFGTCLTYLCCLFFRADKT
ncbi:MAG: DUF2029 domain-containing protein [Candidatus Omnitrophica bacterium]|nr:DUF2029 domain-containing protein [Candidatus Omnitrophota bacterium]